MLVMRFWIDGTRRNAIMSFHRLAARDIGEDDKGAKQFDKL